MYAWFLLIARPCVRAVRLLLPFCLQSDRFAWSSIVFNVHPTAFCRRADVAARIRAAWDEAQRSGKLSARQAARIADMSLLLDVVLKTNTLR